MGGCTAIVPAWRLVRAWATAAPLLALRAQKLSSYAGRSPRFGSACPACARLEERHPWFEQADAGIGTPKLTAGEFGTARR